MLNVVEKLLSICSDEISFERQDGFFSSMEKTSLLNELISLLEKKNGFYGFESALHVFPYETIENEVGILDWNNHDLWISYYDGIAQDALYFAEDAFGGQFCIKGNQICTFDPETGQFEVLANSISQWCDLILKDYSFLTGYPLAHSWQEKNGPIPFGYRLVPKIPFVAGGAYELDNLYVEKSSNAMRVRANLACQIRDVPDGGSITFSIIH